MRMMESNNTSLILKVIFNRGNHETDEVYTAGPVSFKKELEKKGLVDLLPELKWFTSLLSSAIILSCNDKKIWLSHGGIPNTPQIFVFTKPNEILYYNSKSDLPVQIRWNDFISTNTYIRSIRLGANGKEDIFNVTPDQVKKFCEANNISFIIRGHQDFPYNSYILSTYDNYTKKTGNADSRFIFGYESTDHLKPNDYVYINSNKNNDNRIISGPIASVLLDLNISSEKMQIGDKQKCTFYPVITLTTCTDYDRILTHDSFGVIRFDIDSFCDDYLKKKIKTLLGGFCLSDRMHYDRYKENKDRYIKLHS
jgi:hypothetical protein